MQSKIVERLASLAPGERAWFWLCPDARPPLLIQPVRSDPDRKILRAEALSASQPLHATPSLGVVQRQHDGRLTFVAHNLRPHHLDGLPIPGAVLVDIGPDNAVRAIHQEHAPAPPAAPDAAILRRGAWVWLGQHCLWTLASEDPDGRALAERAAAGGGEGISAFADEDADGALRLTTGRPPWTVEPHLPKTMQRAWLVQVDDGQIVRAMRAGGLGAVLAGSVGWFWLTGADRGGAPMLVVDTEQAAVVRAAAVSRGGGREVVGRVKRAPDGALLLRLDAPIEGLDALLRRLPVALPPVRVRARARGI